MAYALYKSYKISYCSVSAIDLTCICLKVFQDLLAPFNEYIQQMLKTLFSCSFPSYILHFLDFPSWQVWFILETRCMQLFTGTLGGSKIVGWSISSCNIAFNLLCIASPKKYLFSAGINFNQRQGHPDTSIWISFPAAAFCLMATFDLLLFEKWAYLGSKLLTLDLLKPQPIAVLQFESQRQQLDSFVSWSFAL